MVTKGILDPDEKVELIHGELFLKELPWKSTHATAISLCEHAIRGIVGSEYLVRTQLPLTLSERDEPLPDLCVVQGTIRDFERHYPTTALLVVEVSETTLRMDRGVKASLYAWAGIPEYWIVNLPERVLEVYRDPQPTRTRVYGYYYAQRAVYRPGETFSALFAPDAVLRVDDLLPSADAL